MKRAGLDMRHVSDFLDDHRDSVLLTTSEPALYGLPRSSHVLLLDPFVKMDGWLEVHA